MGRRGDRRLRTRVRPRGAAAALLPVLQHEGGRHRPRARDLEADRRGARRYDRGRECPGRRRATPDPAAVPCGGVVKRATILVVDDDERLRDTLGILVRSLGHDAVPAADVPGAERVLGDRVVDLVISDLRMPGGSGLDLLDVVRRGDPHTPVIVLTAYGTVATAVEAMKKGAFDYLVKPFDAGEMELRIERALALGRFRVEADYLREEAETRGGLDELIGVSAAMRRVFDLVEQVAPTKTSVLVTGETGTGKELIARAIHRRSPREAHLLVPVNLAAVPVELLESELFGHARGAFTGAVGERIGKFELADRGTLFLDEIGDAPPALQPKILRVVQD